MKVVISSHEPVVADRSGVFCAACRHYDWRCTSVLLLFERRFLMMKDYFAKRKAGPIAPPIIAGPPAAPG